MKRSSLLSHALCILAAVLFAASASAQTTIFSENFGATALGSLPADWGKRVDTGNIYSTAYYGVEPAPGGNSKFIALSFPASGAADIELPAIDFASYAGQTITLSFDMCSWQNYGGDNSLLVGLGRNEFDDPFSVVTWVAGQGVSDQGIYAPIGQWTHITLDLTEGLAAFPDANRIDLLSWNGRSMHGEIFLTNFQVTATDAVSEPAHGALVMGGAALLVLGMRRRRQRA